MENNTLEEYLNDVAKGGVWVFEQEEGSADISDSINESLKDYKVYRARASKRASSVFQKALPQYEEALKIKIPPKVLSSYFISNNGTLITKYERSETGLDSDIFAGMLEAVNSFVKDSLEQMSGNGESSRGGINILSYHNPAQEDFPILISRREQGMMVATFSGEFSKDTQKTLDNLNKGVHKEYSNELSEWNGAMNLDWIERIQQTMKDSLFDSKRFEGELDLTNLNSERMLIKSRAIDLITNESKNQKIAFVFDSAEDIDPLSADLISYFGRNTNIPIVVQYQTGILDEGIKNQRLSEVFDDLKKEEKYKHFAIKSEVDIESLISSQFSGVDDTALKILRYSAVADEFDSDILSKIFPKEKIQNIQKQLVDLGVLKENKFANSRLKQRAIESIPEHGKGKIDRDVADALERKGAEYSPRIAELLLPYAHMNDDLGEKTIHHLIQSAEQFTLAMNFDKALNSYLKAVDIDTDNKRKMDSLEKVLQIEWETTKWDDLLKHADLLESIADVEGDLKKKIISYQKRVNVFIRKNESVLVEQSLYTAERLSEELGDTSCIINNKNSRAIYLLDRGEQESALSILEDTLNLCGGDPENYVLVLSNIGFIHQEKGEFVRALNIFDDCLTLPKGKNFYLLEPSILSNKSLIYSYLGDFGKSISIGKESMEKAIAVGDILTASKVFNTLGNLYMSKLEDFEKAREHFEQALKFVKIYSSPLLEAVFTYNLGELHSIVANECITKSEQIVSNNNLGNTKFGESIKTEIDKLRLNELKRARERLSPPED